MRKEAEEATRNVAGKLKQNAAEIKKLLDEKRMLSKSDREWIVSTLESAGRSLDNDVPFLNELFVEQMDRTVTEAKGEFESYLQNKMNSIALEALSERMKEEEIRPGRNMLPEMGEGCGELIEAAEQEDGMQMNL